MKKEDCVFKNSCIGFGNPCPEDCVCSRYNVNTKICPSDRLSAYINENTPQSLPSTKNMIIFEHSTKIDIFNESNIFHDVIKLLTSSDHICDFEHELWKQTRCRNGFSKTTQNMFNISSVLLSLCNLDIHFLFEPYDCCKYSKLSFGNNSTISTHIKPFLLPIPSPPGKTVYDRNRKETFFFSVFSHHTIAYCELFEEYFYNTLKWFYECVLAKPNANVFLCTNSFQTQQLDLCIEIVEDALGRFNLSNWKIFAADHLDDWVKVFVKLFKPHMFEKFLASWL